MVQIETKGETKGGGSCSAPSFALSYQGPSAQNLMKERKREREILNERS